MKSESSKVESFNILPRRLVAGSGETPPSETVNVAAIGAGARGAADIDGLEEAGARIACDSRVKVGHVGQIVIGEQLYRRPE